MSELSFRIPAELVDAIAETVLERVRQELELDQRRSPYLTVEEAAEFLRCKPQRIYNLRADGRLTRRTEGSRALVLRSEIESLVLDERKLPVTLPRRRVA